MSEQEDEFAKYLTPPNQDQAQQPELDYENMPVKEVLTGAAEKSFAKCKKCFVGFT
jgi:hypothetical protein